MKRIYSKRKRSKATDEALKQHRKMRSKLKQSCPDLLDAVQKLYMSMQSKEKHKPHEDVGQGEIMVDKEKSIETVIKFLELSSSKDMQEKVRSVLSSKLH